MLRKELAPAFKRLVAGFELCDTDNARNPGSQIRGERRVSDGIFKRALRIGSDEANCGCWRVVERMRERYFARFEPLLIDNVFLRGQDEPDWLGARRVV